MVATDDRILSPSQIEVYVNNVRLNTLSMSGGGADRDTITVENAVGGIAAVRQAFASMYDSIEKNYDVEMADSYGTHGQPLRPPD